MRTDPWVRAGIRMGLRWLSSGARHGHIGVRKQLVGELNSPVIRWLDKVLTVHFTVFVLSRTGRG
eukprot:337951-Prorocentrum_minimum.AAC.1